MKYNFKYVYNNKIRLNGLYDVWVSYQEGKDIRIFPTTFDHETGIIKKEVFDSYFSDTFLYVLGYTPDYGEMVEKLQKFMVKEML